MDSPALPSVPEAKHYSLDFYDKRGVAGDPRASVAEIARGRDQPITCALPRVRERVFPGPVMVRFRMGVTSPQWANGGSV